MQVVIHAKDRPNSLHIRLENREAHVAYLKQHLDEIICVGPTLGGPEGGMDGSVLVMEFADDAALETFLEGDPYSKAELFEQVTVLPWKKVLPAQAAG
ncbi:MAG: YciI family protein [Rhodospirillales bacterium]